MPPPSSRMTQNRPQPTRYRPGKVEADDIASEDESSEGEDDKDGVSTTPARQPPPKATSFPSQKLAVDLSRAGQPNSAGTKFSRTDKQEEDLDGFVTASESSAEEDDGSSDEDEDEDDSSEDEGTSSSDEPERPMLRPTFISKAKRAQAATAEKASESDKLAREQKLRQEKADTLLQAQIERDAAIRAAGKKQWDDEDVDPDDEVDDRDGLDVEAEKAAWKLRELKRIRRDRLAIEEKEKEREEIERRRNMTVEEREAEDRAYIDAQKEDREGRGKMGYMQKYFHRGAFFDPEDQDEDVQKALNRDLAGAKFTDETGDKAVLPEYLKVRDMTRLGKKGRTRYKDLKSEDTGRWGDHDTRKRDFEGLDDRFKPDNRGPSEKSTTGANSAPVGERRRRVDDDGYRRHNQKRARVD